MLPGFFEQFFGSPASSMFGGHDLNSLAGALRGTPMPAGLPDAVAASIMYKPSYGEGQSFPKPGQQTPFTSDIWQEFFGNKNSDRAGKLSLELGMRDYLKNNNTVFPESGNVLGSFTSPYPMGGTTYGSPFGQFGFSLY